MSKSAIGGRIKDFHISDILLLMAQQKKTGVVSIQYIQKNHWWQQGVRAAKKLIHTPKNQTNTLNASVGKNTKYYVFMDQQKMENYDTVHIYFHQGNMIHIEDNEQAEIKRVCVEKLQKAGIIIPEYGAFFLENFANHTRQSHETWDVFLAQLANIDLACIHRALTIHYKEILSRAFVWDDGTWNFAPDLSLASEQWQRSFPAVLPVETTVLEMARMLDEAQLVVRMIPHRNVVFRALQPLQKQNLEAQVQSSANLAMQQAQASVNAHKHASLYDDLLVGFDEITNSVTNSAPQQIPSPVIPPMTTTKIGIGQKPPHRLSKSNVLNELERHIYHSAAEGLSVAEIIHVHLYEPFEICRTLADLVADEWLEVISTDLTSTQTTHINPILRWLLPAHDAEAAQAATWTKQLWVILNRRIVVPTPVFVTVLLIGAFSIDAGYQLMSKDVEQSSNFYQLKTTKSQMLAPPWSGRGYHDAVEKLQLFWLENHRYPDSLDEFCREDVCREVTYRLQNGVPVLTPAQTR